MQLSHNPQFEWRGRRSIKSTARSPGRGECGSYSLAVAYLARRRFGYRATTVAVALGYGSGSAVSRVIRRIDNGPADLRRTVERISETLQ